MSKTDTQPRPVPTFCPECAFPVTSSGEIRPVFCSLCGQRLAVGSFHLRQIFGDLVGSLFTLELPFLRTFRDLWKGPGHVANAWISGKRRSYISPIKFIVIIGLVVALTYEPILELRHSLQEAGTATYEVGIAHFAAQYIALICVGLLIPVVFVCRGLGGVFGVTRSALDWYVLGLYTYGLAVAIQLIMNLIGVPFPAFANSVPMQVIEGFLPLGLFTWGAASFVGRDRRWHALAVVLLGQIVAYIVVGLMRVLLQFV